MCPRLGGSAISRNAKRDLGVSSKAHKFACELRALLASDKHLGSAERSERQLPKPNTPASARGTVAECTGFAIAADPSCVSELRSSRFEIRETRRNECLEDPALGGSMCRILRCLEAPGRVWRLEVTNVSRIVSLGGSIYRILRRLEAPGRPDSYGLKVPGGPPLKFFARLRRSGEFGSWK